MIPLINIYSSHYESLRKYYLVLHMVHLRKFTFNHHHYLNMECLHWLLHPAAWLMMRTWSHQTLSDTCSISIPLHGGRCCYSSKLESKWFLLVTPLGGSGVRFSDVSPVIIIIIARDTTAAPALRRADAQMQQPKQNQGLCAPISALHTRTLRQTPLGIMIMKEIQCGTVGAVSVAQQLWC